MWGPNRDYPRMCIYCQRPESEGDSDETIESSTTQEESSQPDSDQRSKLSNIVAGLLGS